MSSSRRPDYYARDDYGSARAPREPRNSDSFGPEKTSPMISSRSKDQVVTSDPRKTIFVGRLDPGTTERTLEHQFGRFGSIKTMRLVRDVFTGQSRRYAFVEYKHSRDAARAYKEAHNLVIDGRRILVDWEQERELKAIKGRKPSAPSYGEYPPRPAARDGPWKSRPSGTFSNDRDGRHNPRTPSPPRVTRRISRSRSRSTSRSRSDRGRIGGASAAAAGGDRAFSSSNNTRRHRDGRGPMTPPNDLRRRTRSRSITPIDDRARRPRKH